MEPKLLENRFYLSEQIVSSSYFSGLAFLARHNSCTAILYSAQYCWHVVCQYGPRRIHVCKGILGAWYQNPCAQSCHAHHKIHSKSPQNWFCVWFLSYVAWLEKWLKWKNTKNKRKLFETRWQFDVDHCNQSCHLWICRAELCCCRPMCKCVGEKPNCDRYTVGHSWRPLHVHAGADPGFWSGGQQSFDPKGWPWAQTLLKIGGFPLKLPENCMIKKKSWGQGGPGPQGPLDPLLTWNALNRNVGFVKC